MPQKIRPSKLWYVFAVAMFLACAGGSMAWLLLAVFSTRTDAMPFIAPGEKAFTAEKRGDYVLRYVEATVSGGHVFNEKRALPTNLVFRVTNASGGPPLELRGDVRLGGRTARKVRYTVGSFRIDVPGDYTITAFGDKEERIFTIAPSRARAVTTAAIGCTLLHLLAYLGAPAIIITVVSRRTRMMNRLLQDE